MQNSYSKREVGGGRMKKYQDALESLAEKTYGYEEESYVALQELIDRNSWIPVSERLPTIKECQENDCRFIVTDGNRRYQNRFDYEDNYFDRCACNGLGLKRDSCVIAWQPLPEPYKEEENE